MVKLATLCVASLWAATVARAPAAIMESTPDGRADIQRVVAAALGKDILIADDALTKSSLLIIERRIPRTMEGRVGSGRILDAPETFELVLDAGQCVLVHRRTDVAYPLENARCRPSPSTPGSSPSPDQKQ